MNLRSLTVIMITGVLLGACAAVKPPPAASVPVSEISPYGLFLAGRGAFNSGQNALASDYYEAIRLAEPGADGLVRARAFSSALLAGRVSLAATLAPDGPNDSEAERNFGKVVRGVEALATRNPKQAQILLAPGTVGFPHRSLASLISPWAAAMAGDADGAVVRPQVQGDKLVEYFGLVGQAELYERAGRFDEAETNFKSLTGSGDPGELVILAYGAFLERRGRSADAQALYDRLLTPEPHNLAVQTARARTIAHKPPPAMSTLTQGAAQAMIAPATGMIAANQKQIGLAYLQLALRLDPDLNSAWLMLGDILEENGQLEAARQAYGHPKLGKPDYWAGRTRLAWSYQRAKDPEMALKVAGETVTAGGGVEARLVLADLLRVNERYDQSADVLTEVIKSDPAASVDWRLLYARGMANDRAGRWLDGEADLKRALALVPDDPEVLNYLGYSWIDRGEHLPEALAMIQKALSQNPRSGAVLDSLGWAYFHMGDMTKALTTLEQAVELEAGDPDINNHLGDAYWQVGRKDEARFQWQRVLTLEPEARLKDEIARKLAGGLPLPAKSDHP